MPILFKTDGTSNAYRNSDFAVSEYNATSPLATIDVEAIPSCQGSGYHAFFRFEDEAYMLTRWETLGSLFASLIREGFDSLTDIHIHGRLYDDANRAFECTLGKLRDRGIDIHGDAAEAQPSEALCDAR